MPFHGDKIVLLQKPLHYSSITYGGLLHTPPPQWYFAARIGAPQSLSVLLSLDWQFDISFSAPQSTILSWLSAPVFHSRLFTALPFRRSSAWMAAPLYQCSSTPAGAPWPGFAPRNYIPRSSINISTPLAHSALHPALHIRHSSLPGGAPPFPPNSSYCLSNSILIHCKLTSHFQSFRYHKSSQTTLEFNFTHSPGSNHWEIQGVPPASLRRWWIVCSCICRPWWDGRFSGWHWDYVRLISFRSLSWVAVSVLPAFIFESLAILFSSPWCSDANCRMLYYSMIWKLIINNNLCIICGGYSYCSGYIRSISDNACSASNEYP